MRVFTDFHHSSLLRSLVLLFEDRLGMELYRPIGMEWWEEGYWAINNARPTAEQFLEVHKQPSDGTSPLNGANEDYAMSLTWQGWSEVYDPGNLTKHKACTFEFFKQSKFDYVIASIPEHVPLFKKLIAEHQPQAKLIVQMGNNWPYGQYIGQNVLASVAPFKQPDVNAFFYHQEFDLDIFYPTPAKRTRKVYTFVNCIKEYPLAWDDFKYLKSALEPRGYEVKSFGGQCPDGNVTGPKELADKMREAEFILHSKPGGDGFGHIIHNAFAVGRPVIARSSQYQGQLAEDLLQPSAFIDLDSDLGDSADLIDLIPEDSVREVGQRAADSFRTVVDYNKEAEGIKQWLKSL